MSLKDVKDAHENIPYYLIQKGSKKGCYQLHKPKDCRHIFPPTNKSIHKCEKLKVETIIVEQPGLGNRKVVVAKKEPNLYPVIMHKSEFDRLRKPRVISKEEEMAARKVQEEARQKAAQESEARKRLLNEKLLPQPGVSEALGTTDPELDGPDQHAYTITRAEMVKADQLLGPRLANGAILASKCHAIRDAQLTEKNLIKQTLEEEDRRLDAIMEENRQAAIAREAATEKRNHQLRQENAQALKAQIKAHENAKIMEMERIEEESIRVNQANIAMQMDEADRLREKHERANYLRKKLDEGNKEILYFKQLQQEEDRVMDLRIANFLKAKLEREQANQAMVDAAKSSKQKEIEVISNAQKAEQDLKNELERLRNLKIQEDVERDFRRKERAAAIKRNRDIKELHEARVNQIQDMYKSIARATAQDQRAFNDAARQNEEYMRRQKEIEEKRKAAIEKHRQEIMLQINEKERARQEIRDKVHNEGVAIHMEMEQQDKYETKIIKAKVAEMRKQKIPEQYVKEVEMNLYKLGYKVTR